MLTLLAAALAADLPDINAPLRTGQKSWADAAVVIGVEDYAFLPDVPFARRDAEAVYNLMVYTRGISTDRVSLLTDGASRTRILAEVTAKAAQVGPGGTLWVFFAGHGAASPTTSERLLLGLDTMPETLSIDDRGLPLSQVQSVGAAHGASVVVWTDACFTGKGRDGQYLLADKRSFVPSSARAGTNVVQWDAATAGQASGPLSGADHGAFTYFSVGALRGWADGEIDGKPDGNVTGEEASAYVTRALLAAGVRDQQPVMLGEGATQRVWMAGAKEPAPDLAGADSAGGTKAAAERFVRRLIDPKEDPCALLRSLQPTSADYRAVFEATAAAGAERDYAPLWNQPAEACPKPDKVYTDVRLVSATTDEIKAHSPAAGVLMGGHERIARLYRNGITIYGFKLLEPGKDSGLSFDGLMYVNGHWVILTKPWRVLKAVAVVDSGTPGFGDEGTELPGGTFTMGSPPSEAGRGADEVQHPVTVAPFVLARTEVSQRLWTELMGRNPSAQPRDGTLPDPNRTPVQLVTWCEAVDFANRLSKKSELSPVYSGVESCAATSGASVTMNRTSTGWRLPTEAEWEYAARDAATGAWGVVDDARDVCSIGNTDAPSGPGGCTDGYLWLAPVANYLPNGWGIYDLAGNVEEWTWDRYGSYGTIATTNPAGAAGGTTRVVRGGSYADGRANARAAWRGDEKPDARSSTLGVRLARSLP